MTAQGLPNGEAAALQHAAAFPGMQPFPGVGECGYVKLEHAFVDRFPLDLTYFRSNGSMNCLLMNNLNHYNSDQNCNCFNGSYVHQYFFI